jgi:hypothetical protein
MQNYCKTIGARAAASALAAGNASAEIEYEIHAGYSTQYIFRGIDLGDDLTEVGVDMATEYMGFDLSAGAWYASWDAPAGVPGFQADVDELDVYAEVSKDLGFMSVAVGYIYYHFPQSNGTAFFVPIQDAQELYLSVSKEFFGFDTSLAYFWDIETDNDGYMEANVSKSFELSPCLVLNAGGTLGYLAEEGDLTHFQTKVSLDWAFTETATLSPYIAHSWSLSEGGRFAGAPNGSSTALYGGAQNEFFGGLSLAVSF